MLSLLAASAASVAVLFVAVPYGIAQPREQPKEQPAREHRGPGVLALLPADSVTERTLNVRGETIAYTATAGTFPLFDQNGERSASIVYTAYVRKGVASESRPITFAFNGGPGASSAYLHLGVVGPKAIDFGRELDGANARLRDNPDTWLPFTDLVMIDPVGTGWSRTAQADSTGFYGVQSDARAIAKVIALYVARNGRGTSPKFLLGESYGGFRAVKVARVLQQEQGVVAGGVIALSPLLDGALQFGASRYALGAALQFPSLAAAELDRGKRFSAEKLAEAERFAMTDYLVTLAGPTPQGEAARAFYGRVAAFTGLPLDVVAQTRGFIRGAYAKRSREGKVVSAYDAAFATPDPFPESLDAEGADAMLDGFLQALGGTFVAYARDELGFKTDMTYQLLNREVSGKWDWGGARGQASVTRDLRELLALNPRFRLLVVHGRSDAVTPYGVSRYVLDHLPPHGEERRVALRHYEGGHMFYLSPASRAAFTADAAAFYRAAE